MKIINWFLELNIFFEIYFGILVILFLLILCVLIKHIIKANKKFQKKEIYFVELIDDMDSLSLPIYNRKELFVFLLCEEMKTWFLCAMLWPFLLIIFIILFIIDIKPNVRY